MFQLSGKSGSLLHCAEISCASSKEFPAEIENEGLKVIGKIVQRKIDGVGFHAR